MGMGRGAAPTALGFLQTLVVFLCIFPAATSQCKILKCNSEFWTATSGTHYPGSEDTPEFCTALRAYSHCTRRTARTCRGDLAYHSAVHGIEDLMSQHNCSKDGPTSQPRLRTLPPGDSQERSDSPEICHYEKSFHKHSAPPNYTHCGLFGDPHLRTFTDRFQTCQVRGAWPLIDNNYLNVQVTNTPVLPGSSATATSKMERAWNPRNIKWLAEVALGLWAGLRTGFRSPALQALHHPLPTGVLLTIIFKNFQECVEQKVYQAEMDELPAAFADGSKNGGDKHGANSLKITEKVSGQHIEIQAKYIGTTIIVRQVGRYLTFAVRMPEEVVNAVEDRDNQGLYLCLRGCPLNEQIDFQAFHATESWSTRRKGPGTPVSSPQVFTYETATARCKEKLPVEDLYFQACVFDLLTTGDVNFTLAAYYAFEDVKMLHSNKDKLHLYERTRDLPGSAAASGQCQELLLSFVAILWCLVSVFS
nr:repulsive guidance molecule A isoform X2 [Phascolarctos cinereus]XP_020819926.1 repulsive guidance molecule A isoform X2 [Phascolarctos cinereus]XP_020819934.1 repulsive guidance molecule A isoform X2 [Phascolarctos cinereus]XP_020819944.1 repulsive guidance molecule A isoform X2 [Phascolarctos cinereus]